MPNRTIAIVEDEQDIRDNYVDAFRRAGYQVEGYANRADALAAFARALPDLALLDIHLPPDAEGGMELCRALRARSGTLPIIFLTNYDSELDIISGLRLGADDYLVKAHITLRHLLARVAALFRRQEALQQAVGSEEEVEVGALRLHPERFEARWAGQLVDLSVTEFEIVRALTRHVGHIKDREQLMKSAGIYVEPNTMTSHIKRIRAKFEAADAGFSMIDTVYGKGYRWNGAAQR